MIEILKPTFFRIAKSLPHLDLKLKQAGMKETPVQFVKKTFFTSFYMTTGLTVFLLAIFSKFKTLAIILAVLFPLLFILVFLYLVKLPDVKIIKKRINKIWVE